VLLVFLDLLELLVIILAQEMEALAVGSILVARQVMLVATARLAIQAPAAMERQIAMLALVQVLVVRGPQATLALVAILAPQHLAAPAVLELLHLFVDCTAFQEVLEVRLVIRG
jgi:hypothetical protein